MANANVLDLDGRQLKTVELPMAFAEKVRRDLILRAVHAESTAKLQPQAHYLLAGMQTTARYYGAMNSYRTGRHMGIAIRPREKLGGGVQGKVKRIPSAVKGKRAHPHKIEKIIAENINSKEYQKAIRSAVSATSQPTYPKNDAAKSITFPIILSNGIEEVKKTKQMSGIISKLGLGSALERGTEKTRRKGIRRLSKQRAYKKSILIVLGNDNGAVKAANNLPGVDVCTVNKLTANVLAPGGVPGRITIWSEAAIEQLDRTIGAMKPE
ncbi:MAG: 50S ribosomal protein L4 [Candidatus Marsarchaeota archaeon]|nr:50S ribosomal protein L4 [Candidatus Marsarchaeota archaeon]MCL5115284.1 50S ribosomal protein L4 [Candidatus Marsarchaeota archaeon]